MWIAYGQLSPQQQKEVDALADRLHAASSDLLSLDDCRRSVMTGFNDVIANYVNTILYGDAEAPRPQGVLHGEDLVVTH